MLVLNRKTNEGFIINGSTELNVVGIKGTTVVMELKENGKDTHKITAVLNYEGRKIAVGNSYMTISVLHTSGTIARLGFDAPKDVSIVRKELLGK